MNCRFEKRERSFLSTLPMISDQSRPWSFPDVIRHLRSNLRHKVIHISTSFEKIDHRPIEPEETLALTESAVMETALLADDRDTAIAAIETLKAEVLRSIDRVLEIKGNTNSAVEEFDEEHCIDFYAEVKKFEIEMIRQALIKVAGNQRAAAQLLGLKHTTLNNKVKLYKIPVHLIAAQRKVRELRRLVLPGQFEQ